MTRTNAAAEATQLASVCRRLEATREKLHDLEQQRNALIRACRAHGVGGTEIARITGLSPGRVTQILSSDGG